MDDKARIRVWALGAAALLMVVALAAKASPAQAAARRPAPWDFSPGVVAVQADKLETAFFKVCGDCHEPDRIRETRRTRGGWEEIIEKMIEKGAVGSDADFELVVQYLLANYGMVNLNQAPAEEIALVIGVPKKDAETIVAYRTEHGKFRNYDALTQVPGLDAKILEAHKASMMF